MDLGGVVPGDWAWYSWDIPAGSHHVWLQAADDLELVVCKAGDTTHRFCSENRGPMGEGCLEKYTSSRPGWGGEIEGPMSQMRLGVTMCNRPGCLRNPVGMSPIQYVLITK